MKDIKITNDIMDPQFHNTKIYIKQELQEVLKFPIEIFWNLEASLKSELSNYFGLWNIDKQRNNFDVLC